MAPKFHQSRHVLSFLSILLVILELFTSKLLDSTMAEESPEIYQMNKLLKIENMDWERQLKQAVNNLDVTFRGSLPAIQSHV